MTREETKKILMGISCSYPNFKPNMPLDFVVDIWNDDLLDYDYQSVYMALKTYKSTDTSGFAPSVGQLISKIQSFSDNKLPTEFEAWSKVMKAISNSSYNAKSEFDSLDEISQRVVGSPENLRSMAMNNDFNEDVEKSLFVRTYKQLAEKQKQYALYPSDVKKALRLNQMKGIESNG